MEIFFTQVKTLLSFLKKDKIENQKVVKIINKKMPELKF